MRSAAMSSTMLPSGRPCTAELTASSTIAATAVTSPVVIITPMLFDTIDVTIIVAMPATNTTAAAMRKAFSVTRPSCQDRRAGLGAFGLCRRTAATTDALPSEASRSQPKRSGGAAAKD